MTSSCPKCGFERSANEPECRRCGVVFAKLRSRPEPAVSVPYEPPPPTASPGRLDDLAAPLPDLYEPPPRVAALPEVPTVPTVQRSEAAESDWRISLTKYPVALGFGLALLLVLGPNLPRFVLSYLGVLVHELGHTALAWLFGYPAIPAFDFTYGGGVSLSFDRSTGVVVLLLALWVGLLGFYRKFPRVLMLLGALFALWVLLAVTPLHEPLTIAMGHGFELLFAGIFLFRAATGTACKRPQVERPLYGMVGWFLVLEQAAFAHGLVTDPGQRQLYADAKGGGHWMDFSRLARDYLGVSLETVAGIFLVACLLTPIVTWAVVRYRDEAWRRWEPWLAGSQRAL